MAALVKASQSEAKTPDVDQALRALKHRDGRAAERLFRVAAAKKEVEGRRAIWEAAEPYRPLGALAFLRDTEGALAAYRKATQLDPSRGEREQAHARWAQSLRPESSGWPADKKNKKKRPLA